MWLARDKKDDKLYLYPSKPILTFDDNKNNIWFPSDDWGCIQLDSDLYPEITYENSPIEFELIIKTNVDSTK